MADRQFLMLIKISDNVNKNPNLVKWIEEIEDEYMKRFGQLGKSVAHLALDGPWHFALVFPGSEASVKFLADSINGKAPGQVEILTMRGRDLDDFRGMRA